MGGMLQHIKKQAELQGLSREVLEREVLASAKARHLAEIAYFAKDSVETCQAWVDAQTRHELAMEKLIEFEALEQSK